MTGHFEHLFYVEFTSEERQLLDKAVDMIESIAELHTCKTCDKVVYDPEIVDYFESLWRAMNEIDWCH